jgi:ectoine hydroxylase-related dioxygenase (phytanoyl-CoA dioxygenase family)
MMNLIKNYILLILMRLNYFLNHLNLSIEKKIIKTSLEKEIIRKLKIYGYCVIKDFINKNDCKKIKKKINLFIKKYPEKLYYSKAKDDRRIHGAELIDNKFIKKYYNSKFIKKIGFLYTFSILKNLMTMANKTKFISNNLGSGGGWHRDNLIKQYKSILYLVDVDRSNGPFQLIKKSQEFRQILKDNLKMETDVRTYRYKNDQVNSIKKNRTVTIEGKAGTLIIVDTSVIHRGSPLKFGTRYALTNYYYPKKIIKDYFNHFKPKLTINDKIRL